MWSQYSKLRFGYNVGQWWMTCDVSLRIIIFTSYGKNVKYQVCLWKKCYANIMHNTVKYYREQTHTRPMSYTEETHWERKNGKANFLWYVECLFLLFVCE